MESSGAQRHFFDLKIPLGSLLGFYGILLVLYGIFSPREIYAKSVNININLIWGVLIMVVGIIFLLVAYFEKGK
ncbi:MAG: hypothetical protein WAO19_13185 [Candidatus Kryptoniota bacterium]